MSTLGLRNLPPHRRVGGRLGFRGARTHVLEHLTHNGYNHVVDLGRYVLGLTRHILRLTRHTLGLGGVHGSPGHHTGVHGHPGLRLCGGHLGGLLLLLHVGLHLLGSYKRLFRGFDLLQPAHGQLV